MTKLETTIDTILQQLKHELASETWESRRRYFNQMIRLAEKLNITEPCQELYDAFIADDNSSPERHSLHVRCVKLIDASVGTQAKNEYGILLNEPSMPDESTVQKFFQNRTFPITNGVYIDYLIVKAGIEMKYLNLTDSTIGQYKHSWRDIRRYFNAAGSHVYDEKLMQYYLKEINIQRSNNSMKEWKWKTNRKAGQVLMEVADTGSFHWGIINKDISCSTAELQYIRLQYTNSLKMRNLSQSTIGLHDYVFRKTIEFAEIEVPEDLLSLTPKAVQYVISKFAGNCNRRSMATILPILRSMLKFLHTEGMIKRELSGIVMGGFVQRGSVASYISPKNQTELVAELDNESKRTRAIIVLALRLGLRDIDVCNLTFQEIDWQHDRIRLVQKKTGEPLVLPLLPDVGNALMDYILNERPKRIDHYPYIFLRKQAPYNKLTSVYSICSKLLNRMGIKPINGNATGVHIFRYSLVHKLLASKVPHQVITDTLGHTSRESDKPYLSMEESMLRMCALDLSVIGGIVWKGDEING
jgi:integrase